MGETSCSVRGARTTAVYQAPRDQPGDGSCAQATSRQELDPQPPNLRDSTIQRQSTTLADPKLDTSRIDASRPTLSR